MSNKVYAYTVLYMINYDSGMPTIHPIPYDKRMHGVPMQYNFSLGLLSLVVRNLTEYPNEHARSVVDKWVRLGAHVRDESGKVMHVWECPFNEIEVI